MATNIDTPRVLIIDDQPESIAILVNFLAERQLDIMIALSGSDGLQKAEKGRPDLILLDIMMPEMDGLETCKRLKSNIATADIPVIFLSASSDIDNKLIGFEVGAVDYITKPFSQEEVLARINLHLKYKQKIELLDIQLGQQHAQTANLSENREEKLFLRAIAFLNNNLASSPTLSEVTNELGTNENKINQIFRKKTGMSLAEFTLDLRLESSRRLLAESDTQIQLIASSVGYRNAGDFTRAFRARYGVSPRDYRKTARNSQH